MRAVGLGHPDARELPDVLLPDGDRDQDHVRDDARNGDAIVYIRGIRGA